MDERKVPADPAAPVALGEQLLAIGRTLAQRGAADRRLRDLESPGVPELTRPRAQLLVELHHGPARIGALAKVLGVVPRTLTPMVDSLEAAGLLVRTSDPHDRRATLLRITTAGTTALEVNRSRSFSTVGRYFTVLDETERAHLAAILARLQDAIDAAPHGSEAR